LKESMKRTAARGAVFLFIILCTLLAASGCGQRKNWVMFRGENGRGATSTTLTPPLGIKWKLKLQDREERAYAFNNPVVLEDTIYFGSTDGNIYALDIESGYMRWVYKTTGAINSVPYADDSRVYVGSNDGKLYALSQKDGSKDWSFQADSTIQSTIIKDRDSIMFVSDGGHVYSLDPETGREQYTIPNPIWFYFTFQVYDNVIYFAPGPVDRPHSMGAWDIESRSYLWLLDTALFDAVWYSFPAIEGDLLYFSTMNPFLDYWELKYYAFHRKTGQQVWSYADYAVWPYGQPLDTRLLFEQYMRLLDYLAPSLWQDLVIYTSGDSVVRALDRKTGQLTWEHQFDTITTSAPTVAGDYIYFGIDGTGGGYFKESPKVVCLSARTGRKMWEMDIDGRLLSAPVIAQNWMIFGTDTNHFYVLEALF
jgi:outer membrane protein assembly factor BamB